MVTTGIVAAATLLGAAPTLAIEVDIGPGGVRVGPRYRDYEERSYLVIDPIIAIGILAIVPIAGR